MWKNAVGAFALALFAAAGGAGKAAAQNTFTAGDWRGGPYFKSNAFSHCAVYRTYANGISLIIQLTAKLDMYLGASKQGWSMDPNGNFNIVFDLPGYKKSFQGRVSQEHREQIWFGVGNEPALRRALAGGGTMTWTDVRGTKLTFQLDGGDNAMRKLITCAALYGVD
jgi:hypothetical protein